MAETLSAELVEVRERLRYDTPFWAQHCATILTDTKQPVRLVARPWQLEFDAALERQRAAGRPMRAIILKARKLGFSTWVQARFMQAVSQRPFRRAVTLAHLRSSAGELMDMAERMYANLPSDQQLAELIYGRGTDRPAPFSVRPQIITQGSNRQGQRWLTLGSKARPTEGSTIETMTAGGKGAGRGATPTDVHVSEAAHIEDPDFLAGALNAIPMRPDTTAILESTACGFNHFYDTWDLAVRGASDPETGVLWTPLFFGWQDNPYNVLAFISDQARDRFERTIGDADGGGDEEEPWLVSEFGVTLEQLNWRRAILNGPECRGKVELFHQEHPATPEQAFIGSGNPVFPGILVSKMITAATAAPEPVKGVLRADPDSIIERTNRHGVIRVPQRALWVPETDITDEDRDLWGHDSLVVWEHPRKTVQEVRAELAMQARPRPGETAALDQADERAGQYVVFADVAEGLGATAQDGDYSAVQVLDHVERTQVARFRSRIPISDLPHVLLLIALYFNEAMLAPEVNSIGIGVCDTLQKELRYRRLYRRRRAGDDRRQGTQSQLIGWATTLRTKPLMEQTMGQALKDETHGCRDPLTAREFTTYVEDERGRHGAQAGTHDDLVMSFMGAHRVASEMRPRDPSKRGSAVSRTVDPLTGY